MSLSVKEIEEFHIQNAKDYRCEKNDPTLVHLCAMDIAKAYAKSSSANAKEIIEVYRSAVQVFKTGLTPAEQIEANKNKKKR